MRGALVSVFSQIIATQPSMELGLASPSFHIAHARRLFKLTSFSQPINKVAKGVISRSNLLAF
jgi:hypothetical protein